jgi:hypothetical protein
MQKERLVSEHSDDIGCDRHSPFASCSERYQIGEDQD